ncbi:hypothetical protein [Mycobacterium sp.]|uniref:hypothetical protein n=1 Tax=Mycobacterium sp. TaxID=1785 RepID=UPI002D87B5F8|nr:hypothetical protein [Mycobacterium sp.]
MACRFVVWVSAGILTAGLSAALIAGAGVAAAETENGSDAGGATSSESTNSTADEPNSTKDDEAADPEPTDDAADDTGDPADGPDVVDPAEPADDDDLPATSDPTAPSDEPTELPEDPVAQLPADETEKRVSNDHTTAGSEIDETVVNGLDEAAVTTEPDIKEEQPVAEAKATQETTAEPETASVPEVPVVPTVTESVDSVVTALAFAAPEPAAAAAPAGPTLINVIGTLFFSVFDFVVKLVEGPPVIPPGANVTVGRSSLRIDCGDGYFTDADWYFPTEGEPDKLIYLQHGAFARAGLYNVTAAELAERNNAIVVAPSITTNFFACDGCTLSGEQMHAAVAKLFLEDRAAMLASAQAAGFTGTSLPQRFVLAGHSGGGQTAGGAAGYYAQFAPADRLHDMAGVLLLDTSHVGGAIERGVGKIPLDIPVYHIAAAPAVLNTYGGINEVLARVRPGFVGVQLIGGVHADAWQSTNAFAEFIVGLGTGFPTPQNVEAVQVVTQGWISDWFNNTHTDEFYGDRGDVIPIETPAGLAQAYVIPGPAPQLTIIDYILKALIESTAILSQFSGNCAADPGTASTLGAETLKGACTASGVS